MKEQIDDIVFKAMREAARAGYIKPRDSQEVTEQILKVINAQSRPLKCEVEK